MKNQRALRNTPAAANNDGDVTAPAPPAINIEDIDMDAPTDALPFYNEENLPYPAEGSSSSLSAAVSGNSGESPHIINTSDMPRKGDDISYATNQPNVIHDVNKIPHNNPTNHGIKQLYHEKINQLHTSVLNCTDVTTINQYMDMIERLKEACRLLDESKTIVTAPVNKHNAKKINDIPIFQLIDDSPSMKTENKICHDSAESFVSTFESVLEANHEDLDTCWKLYLHQSFLCSKNDIYVRFYQAMIKPLPETTKWKDVREMVVHRFDITNPTKNYKLFVQLKQGPKDSIRDYVDKFIEMYHRLPGPKRTTDTIDVARFIFTLLPKTRDEVEKSLRDHQGEIKAGETYYPNNLEDLFSHLQKNIGNIQEALYLSITNGKEKISQPIKRIETIENDQPYKRAKYTEKKDGGEFASSTRNLKNPCGHCKKSEFSYEHLKTCVPYLQSDVYKRYLLRENEKKNNQKVHILYIGKSEHETDSISDYSKLYKTIESDQNEAFHELETLYKFNTIKYHNYFNKQIIKRNNFECYMIDNLTEDNWKNMSPYSLAITINNEQIIAILDTGAEISLINKAYKFEDQSVFENPTPNKGLLIFAGKGSSAKRIGQTKPLEVSYKGKPSFTHAFEILEMHERSNIPFLIGRDLIPLLGIRVENLAYNFDEQEETVYEDTVNQELYIPNKSKACSDEEYEAFMERMEPYLTANKNIDIHELCPLKEAKVYLKTPPNEYAYTRQYPIANALQPVVRAQIKKWLDDKTIETAAPSGFNNPLTLVPKPPSSNGDKKWRVCLDTRRINNLLEEVSNVNTPLIEDIFHSLSNSKIYSVFDITGAFHRLEINAEDRHKLTFGFDGKSYQFRGACFGLKSLSGIFQNMMETIFADMKEFTCIYIDDLVCHSKDLASHEIHCKQVIEALTKYKLPLNQEKTYLARNSVHLLGFSISEQGKSIDPNRLTNIDEWPKPKTAKAMMKVCGIFSYLRSHIPMASHLTAPLDALRYSTKKVLEWTPEMDKHYDSIVAILKQNIVLSHPDLNHPFSLSVDASHYAVGACLFQEFIDKDTGVKTIKYIGFSSKALSKSQRSYSVTKKELYALTTGLTRYYKFLHGDRPFNCYTDHRPIQYIFTCKHLSMMMMRYIEVILSFPNMNIVWIPGKDNVIADKLSRLFPEETDNVIFEKDEKELFPHIFKGNKNKQNKNKIQKKHFINNNPSKLQSQKDFIKKNQNINLERIANFKQFYVSLDNPTPNLPVVNNTVMVKRWSIRTVHDILDENIIEPSIDEDVVVEINYVQNMDESYIVPPEEHRQDILKSAHEFGHFGAEAIMQRIRKDEGMNWPNMIKDALEIVKQCRTCQKFVIGKRGYNPLKPLYCYTPGWHYQMDLCGPFPITSTGATYILVLLDVATRFVVLRSLPDKSAKTVAGELISIFSLIGYPRIINSDRGLEWKNSILDNLCAAMNVDKRLSTAYYSQGNGGAERAVQNTKKLLSKLILGVSNDNWHVVLESVQLMLNCKVSKRLNTSPFNLMFARKMSNDYPLFADPKDDIQPMDNDELLKRIEYMSDVVFPAIKERTDVYNKLMKKQFDKKHRLVDFPVGSFVVVHKKGIQKSLSPVYEGPYEVVRKTDNGNYTLRDEMNLLLPREHTPSELKLVSQDAVIAEEEVYEFDGIIQHRGPPGNRSYRVRWKNYGAKDDSWITADYFTDPQSIVEYWKRVNGSIRKEDKDQLKLTTSDTSGLPVSFDKTKRGPLLQQLADGNEKDASTSTPTKTTKVNKKVFKQTSTKTKPTVKNNPAGNAFRHSRRNQGFAPAMDTTRYRK